MKRMAIAFLLTVPVAAVCFGFAALTGVRGVDLAGGTAIMSLTTMYLWWTENVQFTRKKV